MTIVACADCDTILFTVEAGQDVDSVEWDKHNCSHCSVRDDITGEL